MASMMDGVSRLWVVETQGRGLSVCGYKDEFQASAALLYRLWLSTDLEELKRLVREMAEDVCSQLERDLQQDLAKEKSDATEEEG